MSLVLPQHLIGKTLSQVVFHLILDRMSYAQCLPCEGSLLSPVAAIFLLCTASAADKCSGDQSAKTARTPWDVSAAQIYTRTEECFFSCPDAGTQPWLDLRCASPEGACSTVLLRPNKKERNDLLLVISSSRSDTGSRRSGLGGPGPSPVAHPIGNNTQQWDEKHRSR